MNYSRFLTALSKNRRPSIIRELTNILATASPEMVFLAGGLPNPELFPFAESTMKLKDGSEFKIDGKLMESALQYGPTPGYPPFVQQLKSLTKRFHNPPMWDVSDLLVTSGSQDGLSKAIEMLILPNDYVIVQEPCYTGTLAILNPYKPKYLAVKGDSNGMCPDSLASIMERWKPEDIIAQEEGVPKMIYINTNAANPSGVSISTERRHEIYKIAQKYNLLILEDDPYYFVQFDDMKNFSPSFLSLDTDGRVLRFDSFSKLLSSGMRLGYVTGHKDLIKPILLHMQSSILHASSLSQVVCSELLKKWGDEGFDAHVRSLQSFYKQRRDMMLASAEKHLKGLCEWTIPTGGMFLWFKVNGVEETWDMVMEKGIKKNVILVPGKAFMTDQNAPCPYMRASFSLASPENIELGMKYLADVIKD